MEPACRRLCLFCNDSLSLINCDGRANGIYFFPRKRLVFSAQNGYSDLLNKNVWYFKGPFTANISCDPVFVSCSLFLYHSLEWQPVLEVMTKSIKKTVWKIYFWANIFFATRQPCSKIHSLILLITNYYICMSYKSSNTARLNAKSVMLSYNYPHLFSPGPFYKQPFLKSSMSRSLRPQSATCPAETSPVKAPSPHRFFTTKFGWKNSRRKWKQMGVSKNSGFSP